MCRSLRLRFFHTTLFLLFVSLASPALAQAQGQDQATDTVVTLLFTNDMESAYEPFPAFWIDGMEEIGGIAELTTLINNIRASEPNVFLFDAGDIFTGALSRLTGGALM